MNVCLALLVCFLCSPLFLAEGARRLTTAGGRNGQPAWSPDGKQIAFVSNRGGSWDIWLIGSAGGEATQVSSAPGAAGSPAWSPDGRVLYFYAGSSDEYRIRELDLTTQTVEVNESSYQEFRPAVHPDGSRLMFDRAGGGLPNHDIFVLDLDDGTEQRLTRDRTYDSDAKWSPDGSAIVFHSDRGESEYQTQIWWMTADGGDQKPLTSGPAVNGYPNWSPDGRCIVFTSELDGNRDIWIMKANGESSTRLTRNQGFDGDPAWSPDGNWIVFSTDRFGGQELALMAAPENCG